MAAESGLRVSDASKRRHTGGQLTRKASVVCARMLPLAHHLLPRPSSLACARRPLFTLPDLSKLSPFSQPDSPQTYNERKILPCVSRVLVCCHPSEVAVQLPTKPTVQCCDGRSLISGVLTVLRLRACPQPRARVSGQAVDHASRDVCRVPLFQGELCQRCHLSSEPIR